MKKYHLIGIGGSGLSAIAKVLLEQGQTVSGSDRQLSPMAQALQQAGAQVFIGHQAENIAGADVVIRSSAVPENNVEVKAALEAGLTVLKRADFFQSWLADYEVIAVAGTHGKTTTTAMIAWILTVMGQNPSYIIGGLSVDLGANAHAGSGPQFVIEADEYDRMFLGLRPRMAVVTTVEHDHPDCFPTPDSFRQAFQDFVDLLGNDGVLIVCEDDPGAAELSGYAAQRGLQKFSYGTDPRYDYFARNVAPMPGKGITFDFVRKMQDDVLPVNLQTPGLHNVRNALAALAIVDRLGLPLPSAVAALGDFHGAGRRFEVRGEWAGVVIVDDYAHHPTEIRATLAAARARYPERRIWAVWQPHTYSRTRLMLDRFATAFEDADRVRVTEIYAAREQAPPDGFSAQKVVRAMIAHARDKDRSIQYVADLDDVVGHLMTSLKAGDVVLVLSAGDADQISLKLSQRLAERESVSVKGMGR